MQTKTIGKVISKKVNEWINSIEDKNLSAGLEDKVIVTGGCIVSMLQGEPVNDFDIYFKDEETARKIATYYMEKMGATIYPDNDPRFGNLGSYNIIRVDKDGLMEGLDIVQGNKGEEGDRSRRTFLNKEQFEDHPWDHLHIYIGSRGYLKASDAVTHEQAEEAESLEESKADLNTGPQVEDGRRYQPKFISSNAITLGNKIQLITRFTGTVEQVHEYFDYIHCTCSWTKETGLVLPQEALVSIMEKSLRFIGSKYPVCSVFRSRKYIQRGWRIDVGQYAKMMIVANQFDLTEPRVLQDQLVGVDSAYFQFMLNHLLREDKLDERGYVNTDYAIALLTEIFDHGRFDPNAETEQPASM